MADTTEAAPKDLMGFLDFYLVKKAPFQLPDAAKEAIVKFGPWVVVVLLILSLPLVLFALGLGALGSVFAPFGGGAYAYSYVTGFGITTIFIIAYFGLEIAALPGLFARRMSGWNLMFYARIATLIFSLLIGSIVAGLVSALIGLYVLFQIRSLYH